MLTKFGSKGMYGAGKFGQKSLHVVSKFAGKGLPIGAAVASAAMPEVALPLAIGAAVARPILKTLQKVSR
jgi:hypothetical protein